MDQLIADSVGGRKFAMLLLGVFAFVALLLAVVGLYAVMSYMVTQRNHEIGVRMALGASAADVQRMVVRQGLTLVAIGLGIGLAASLALARVLATLVNGVSATDPLTLGAVGFVLAVAATLASLLPGARRHSRRPDGRLALRIGVHERRASSSPTIRSTSSRRCACCSRAKASTSSPPRRPPACSPPSTARSSTRCSSISTTRATPRRARRAWIFWPRCSSSIRRCRSSS